MEAPRDLGGLGFGSFKFRNLGPLAKYWWRFSTELDPLWKRVVKSTNVIDTNIASITEFKKISMEALSYINKITQKFLWIEGIIQVGFRIKLGRGDNILF